MANVINVNALEQLRPFLNDKSVMEIVVRGENKRIEAFQKVLLINEHPQMQEKEALESVVHVLNRNTLLNEQNLRMIGNVANLQKIGLLLNGLNLCATCVGFAIMYEKLDKMSVEIGQQINQVKNLVKQGQGIQADYEFNKILADHTDMLDCRRKQQPYSEEQMRDLVDREYNVLSLLINVFQKDISADNEATIFSIFSLLAMFTVSLKYFDEVYYVNNHEALGEKAVWHASHDKWTAIYATLSSDWFIEKLQDYAAFETNLNTREIDVYYTSLADQVIGQKEEVEDNQKLIVALGDAVLLNTLREMTNKEVEDIISEAYSEACGSKPADEVNKIFENAFEQMALA